MRVVYIDSLFLLNLILNYLLLRAAAAMAGAAFRRWRLALGAVAGAAYAVLVFMPGMSFLDNLLMKCAVSLLMALLAYGRMRMGEFIRMTLLFYAVSFALGGCVLAVGLLTGRGPSGIPYIPVDLKTLLLATGIGLAVLILVGGRIGRHGGLKGDLQRVKATLEGREVTLTALMDSGHSLRDPLSGSPVLIARADVIGPLLPTGVRSVLDGGNLQKPVETLEHIAALGEGRRFRLVSYQSVGVDSGLLLAFRPDSVIVGRRPMKDMLIALSPTRFPGPYTALCGI